MRRSIRSGAAVLLIVIATFAGTATAADAAAYRFWGFYQWTNGAWAFATKGAAQVTPPDGAVEGWRLAVSGETTPPRLPRANGDFDQICATTPAEPGKKRVAVVMDFGLPEEAPAGSTPPDARGDCAVVDAKASSAQVLAEVATVREEKGLVCAIDTFPASGCGDQVDADPKVPSPEPAVQLVLPEAASPTPTAEASTPASPEPQANESSNDGGGGNPALVWIIVGVAIVLALGAAVIARRRGSGNNAG